MSNIKRRIREQAIALAHSSDSRFRVGAIIFRGSKILGRGINDMGRCHPKSKHPWGAVHAEFDAIRDAALRQRFEIKGAAIYIHRLKKDGTSGIAKPCSHCARMLSKAGIRRIRYSTDEL